MNETISADPEVIRAAMKRLSNLSDIIESGRKDLPPAASVCVAMPAVAAEFQSAFEEAISKVTSLAEGLQVQLAGNSQNIWKAAEELSAVDTEMSDALINTEAKVLELEQSQAPATTAPGGVPNVYTGSPTTANTVSSTTTSGAAPTVGDAGGER